MLTFVSLSHFRAVDFFRFAVCTSPTRNLRKTTAKFGQHFANLLLSKKDLLL